jgi:cell wall-associated NlpC family hydrolase
MTSNTHAIARHRAEVQRSAHLSSIARAVSDNAGGVGRQAAVIAAASGLVLTSGVAANAVELPSERNTVTTTLEVQATKAPIQAPADAKVSFNKTPVKAVAAPVVVAPVVQPQAETVEVAPVEAPVVEAPEPEAAVDATLTVAAQPAVAEAPAQAAPEVSSGVAATIAAAAKAQLGVTQDCTRLASNSLAAAGINFHGWPAGYLSLGRTVSAAEAIPGDLIYYADGGMGAAHIAVYIGGGQAVHGGFNGNQTVIAPAELGSGGVYIRVGG